MIQGAFTSSSSIRARQSNAVMLKLKGKTLVKMGTYRVYFEVEQKNAGRVAVCSRQHNPPVCHELACRTISHSIPQYRLKFTLLSNSRHNQESELALCPPPQRYPNRLACCLKPAPTPHLVFSLSRQKALSPQGRHTSNPALN